MIKKFCDICEEPMPKSNTINLTLCNEQTRYHFTIKPYSGGAYSTDKDICFSCIKKAMEEYNEPV